MLPYGNHARGAKFTNVTHWADEALITSIDEVCRQIPNFYYGRLDIRYNTLEELKQGKNFRIIELNGAGSEPTHIYDPESFNIFCLERNNQAFDNLLYSISIKNNRSGHPHMTLKQGLGMLKENKKLVSKN